MVGIGRAPVIASDLISFGPGPGWTSPAEHGLSLRLARERQQLSHEGVYNPTWLELTIAEQDSAALDARNYLRSALRAGLLTDSAELLRIADDEHFHDCHPDQDKAPERPAGCEPAETEPCWHCGTLTTRGCDCADCWDNADYVPPSAASHCARCGRWWAWLGLSITTITITGGSSE